MVERTVSVAGVEHAGAIAALVNSAYRPAAGNAGWTHEGSLVSGARVSAAQVANSLSGSVVLLGRREGTVLACVQLTPEGNEIHIGMLAVAPRAQGRSLGSAMLQHAEWYAQSRWDAERFVLHVLSPRWELIQYYVRRGYQATGEKLPYPRASGVGTPLLDLYVTVLQKRLHRPCADAARQPQRPS